MLWIPYSGAAVTRAIAVIGYFSEVITKWSHTQRALPCEQLEELAASGQ